MLVYKNFIIYIYKYIEKYLYYQNIVLLYYKL